MAIHSMTGFGQADGVAGAVSWRIEVRSVNGRGLDMRLRLPPGAEALDPLIRSAARSALKRGALNVTVNVTTDRPQAQIKLNDDAVQGVLTAIDAVAEALGQPAPDRKTIDPMRILSVRGVLDSGDPNEALSEETRAAIEAGFRSALDALIADRRGEGERLATVMSDQIEAIDGLVAEAERSPARAPDAIKERLARNIGRLTETDGFDEARLTQEAVILATKADIREELDRLHAHVASARDLLANGGAVGRRLDFLAQEFNREANTLCSKSNDADITRIGMELKVVIDQFREQVQNIE